MTASGDEELQGFGAEETPTRALTFVCRSIAQAAGRTGRGAGRKFGGIRAEAAGQLSGTVQRGEVDELDKAERHNDFDVPKRQLDECSPLPTD
jgi:hypothetical protein